MAPSPARRLTGVPAVTATRIVVKGATHAVTRRTTFRKAFLAPWDPRVEQCWLYALAYAQHRTKVAVHHGVRVITHHHLSITLAQENLGAFLKLFHGELSCALNALLARERYDQPRNVFDGRTSHCMRLLDASAQASHLSYEYLNPVAAGLVARPEHMPGTVLDWGHWKSGGLWVRRPDVYFDPDTRPEWLWLSLTPPPLLMRAFDGDLEALIHHMRRVCDDGIRALRDARRRPPLGAQKVQRLHPWTEPKTLAEPGGRMVPSFKVGARGLIGRKLRCEGAKEVRTFRADHEESRLERLAGRPAVFPHGTYGMRVFHGVTVAKPRRDAMVALPGPLLDEVLRDLEAGARDAGAHVQVLDEVRAAWAEEAEEVVATDELDFACAAPAKSASTTKASDSDSESAEELAPPQQDGTKKRPRREAEVRHRFDRESDGGEDHARRLIIERDRRRGRPPKKPGGSDPPS